MGVSIGGEWHEELADPGEGSYDSAADYNADSAGTSWGSGLNTTYGSGNTGNSSSMYGNTDMSGIMKGFAESSGFSIKQLEEQKRQFDETLNWQKQMWTNQGLPQLAIQQRVQDLEERKFAELTGQATRQQNWVEEIGKRQAALAEKAQTDANAIAQGQLGVAQGGLELQREIQRRQAAVAEQGLGLDVLKTQASLSGPSNWIQAANFSRGVGAGNLPGFVNQLLSGQNTSVLGGPQPGMQQSSPLSLMSMASQYGQQPQQMAAMQGKTGQGMLPGQTAGGGPIMEGGPGVINQLNAQQDQFAGQGLSDQQRQVAMQNAAQASQDQTRPQAAGSNPVPSDTDVAAAQLKSVYAKGGAALGPQQLEGLTKTEMDMFTGGGGAVGADVPGFLAQYERSRIGQKSGALV